ncbi:hypothetical protein KJ657_04680 [Patescibacteria group bacterium]|nr:hypothetical protein [Patescibacteria group bacterium]MBU1016350.1 hypothetical protein [Patescibacteria group bacterium]MBU1684644.1 hypothetical protein [Patescibacteria group bacterium]MBU1938420.1 hypothetical protein [Patescibacteria group bacterium]
MNEHDLLWAMLPDGLDAFFDVESFEKTDRIFRITLTEKNTVPAELPKQYRGKRVINTVFKPVTVDFFPIKGRKTEIILKRRRWRFEGVDTMLRRDIALCAEGTKLEKEFADFLKEFN